MTEEILEVSTKVKFLIGGVPIIAFREVQKRLEKGRPRVPILFIADKEREEPNPNDPDYLDALAEWNEDTEMKLMDFIIMSGTSVSFIPDDIEKIESEDWAEQCRYLGLEIPDNGKIRYLNWIKYIACPTADDMKNLILAASRTIGVTEEDVAESAALFQDNKTRRTNRTAPSKAHS